MQFIGLLWMIGIMMTLVGVGLYLGTNDRKIVGTLFMLLAYMNFLLTLDILGVVMEVIMIVIVFCTYLSLRYWDILEMLEEGDI